MSRTIFRDLFIVLLLHIHVLYLWQHYIVMWANKCLNSQCVKEKIKAVLADTAILQVVLWSMVASVWLGITINFKMQKEVKWGKQELSIIAPERLGDGYQQLQWAVIYMAEIELRFTKTRATTWREKIVGVAVLYPCYMMYINGGYKQRKQEHFS